MDTLTLLLDLLGALFRTTSHDFYFPLYSIGCFLCTFALIRRVMRLA